MSQIPEALPPPPGEDPTTLCVEFYEINNDLGVLSPGGLPGTNGDGFKTSARGPSNPSAGKYNPSLAIDLELININAIGARRVNAMPIYPSETSPRHVCTVSPCRLLGFVEEEKD
jgi:hypothetical protein